MKKLILSLCFLPTLLFADARKYSYEDPQLNAEFDSVYYNLLYSTVKSTRILGTTTNDSAAAGRIGEVISSGAPQSSLNNLTSGISNTIASISLTVGDWDVRAMGGFKGAAGTSVTELQTAIGLTNNTLPATDTIANPTNGEVLYDAVMSATVIGGNRIVQSIPPIVIKLASPATVYLTQNATFSVSTLGGFGSITARRVR